MNRSETEGGMQNELNYDLAQKELKELQGLNIKDDGVRALQIFLNKYANNPTGDMDSLKVDNIMGVKTKDRLKYWLEMNEAAESPDSMYAAIINDTVNQSRERQIIETLKEIDKDILK